MSDISFTVTDENDLDIVAPLWQKLKAHHRARSECFKEQFDPRNLGKPPRSAPCQGG